MVTPMPAAAYSAASSLEIAVNSSASCLAVAVSLPVAWAWR